MNYTNFWIFLNNPKSWSLYNFLQDLKKEELELTWTVPKYQIEYFSPGQYGILRIGKDSRNKKELGNEKRLEAGIYAIVKIKSKAKLKENEQVWDNKYNLDKKSSYLNGQYCVELEVISNLVDTPLLLKDIKAISEIKNDSYLVKGFQAASIPLSKIAFNKIQELIKTNIKSFDEKIFFHEIDNHNLIGKEREVLTKARIGQSQFKELLKEENKCCPICGLKNNSFLIASHIKPWSKSNDKEKVDINNGFLFCPNHDCLFDKGFISFDTKGNLLISSLLQEEEIKLLGLDKKIKLNLSKEKKEYLKWHKDNIFKK